MLVNVWTDGACSSKENNGHGPGGWAAILQAWVGAANNPAADPYAVKEITGGKHYTTAPEMELEAILGALRALINGPHTVVVHTDCQLAIGWLSLGWKRKASHLRPILNEIDALMKAHQVSFRKVKAHNGDRMNERADALAHGAVERYR